MEIRNSGHLSGTSWDRFTRPTGGLMHKLFIKHFVLEEVFVILLQKILSGEFKPSLSKEMAHKLFSDNLSGTFPFYKPEEMDSMDKWRHIINGVAAYLCSDLDYLQSADARDSKEDLIAARQSLATAVKTIKAIEDWLYYHPEALKAILNPGLIPKTLDPKRSFIVTNVLVVDDDINTMHLCKGYFVDQLGLDLSLADPAEPKKHIEKLIESREIYAFDMIVMDGNLPGTSGTELIGLIRGKIPDYSGYIIANSNMYTEQEAMIKGGADFSTPYPKNLSVLKKFFFEI